MGIRGRRGGVVTETDDGEKMGLRLTEDMIRYIIWRNRGFKRTLQDRKIMLQTLGECASLDDYATFRNASAASMARSP